MDWVQWVIPLIAVAVYIISALAKPKDEVRPRTQFPPLPQGGDPAERPSSRRTPEEIDRFLEEVRRRKKSAEQQREKKPIPPVIVQERPRPAPAVPVPTPKRERPRLAEPPRPQLPPARPLPAPRPREPEPLPVPMAEVIEATVALQPPAAAVVARPSVSPVAQSLTGMLRNPSTLAAAIMLKEVLDRPLCKRRRS